MKLTQYMATNGLSKKAFAALLGPRVQPSVVSRYLRGQRRPSPEFIALIYTVTNGAVGPDDWYELPSVQGGQSSVSENQVVA